MSTSKEAIATKYKLFPKHDNREYHSPNLPKPNVIRIEPLSPEARVRYLGGFFGVMEVFRNSLMESLSSDDSYRPFYGFFDPTKYGASFGISAKWKESRHDGFGMISDLVNKVPLVGTACKAASSAGKFIMSAAGLDNKSTGAGTLRAFDGAQFDFGKDIECTWYMPEQENMARLSISRLLKLCFVRNFSSDGDFTGALSRALKSAMNSQAAAESFGQLSSAASSAAQSAKDTVMSATPTWMADGLSAAVGAASDAIGFISGAGGGAASAVGDTEVAGTTVGALAGEAKDEASDAVDYYSSNASAVASDCAPMVTKLASSLINNGLMVAYQLNAFLGGSLTVNPVPVRLTLGHILDIEPVVIESVNISSSAEQFISDDGTHIPLFVTAKIHFGMWMVPDPNKGFVQFMGDDVFNSGHNVKNTQGAGTSGGGSGSKKK